MTSLDHVRGVPRLKRSKRSRSRLLLPSLQEERHIRIAFSGVRHAPAPLENGISACKALVTGRLRAPCLASGNGIS
jgi:hypothetical protein